MLAVPQLNRNVTRDTRREEHIPKAQVPQHDMMCPSLVAAVRFMTSVQLPIVVKLKLCKLQDCQCMIAYMANRCGGRRQVRIYIVL